MSARATTGRPILVPVDPSVFSVGSLRFARTLALETGASVHLVRVRSRSDPQPSSAPRREGHPPARAADACERYLDGIGAYFSSELGPHRVRTATLDGDSLVATLGRYAREQDAAMLVMTGGRDSVAARVGEEAGVPVLIVHPWRGAAGADVELVGAPRPGGGG